MTVDQADPDTRKGRQEVLLSGHSWGGKGKERLGKWRPPLRNRAVPAWLSLGFQDKGVVELRAKKPMAKGSLKQILVAQLNPLGLDCENTTLLAFRA